MKNKNRIQFVSDYLGDQIVEGRKTASCEWLNKIGAVDRYNSALRVGDYYGVYDQEKNRKCFIRITGMELCRWNDIPERLWRGEANLNADEFRAEHLEYFNNPADDFEFVAYYFILIGHTCVR